MSASVAPAWMALISWAVTKGIATSITTSPETMIGVAIEAPLNSRMLPPMMRAISRPVSSFPSSFFFM